MVLVLATQNRDKAKEIQALLPKDLGLEILTMSDFPALDLPPETGSTYRENAIGKALFVAQKTGHHAMGDDSGLEIDALDGAPGLYSARFAGEAPSYLDNRAKVLTSMASAPNKTRTARFVCTVALCDPQGKSEIVEGVCEGEISTSDQGKSGFGYDPIFFYPPLGKTFSELSAKEKNTVSHRGQAMRAVSTLLKQRVTASRTPAIV